MESMQRIYPRSLVDTMAAHFRLNKHVDMLHAILGCSLEQKMPEVSFQLSN